MTSKVYKYWDICWVLRNGVPEKMIVKFRTGHLNHIDYGDGVKIETPKVDQRLYKTTLKVRVNDRIKFLSTVKPEVLAECLNEAAWSSIESGLARKAKALGIAFIFQGCTVTKA